MLAYVLALVVGFGSFYLYMAAFFIPEVHRKYDLVWSGVGLFYALVLWVCAGRITGGVLLGQMASVALLGWFGWQTLALRREQTPFDQQTQFPDSATSVVEAIYEQLRRLQITLHDRSGQFDSSWSGQVQEQAIALLVGLIGWVNAWLSTTFNPIASASGQRPQAPSTPLTSTSAATPTADIAAAKRESAKSAKMPEPISDMPQDRAANVPPQALRSGKNISGVNRSGAPLPPASSSAANAWTTFRNRIRGIWGGSGQHSAYSSETEASLPPDPQTVPRVSPSDEATGSSKDGVDHRKADAIAATEFEAELQAEWDDLDIETHPELDTVDGATMPTDSPASLLEPLKNGGANSSSSVSMKHPEAWQFNQPGHRAEPPDDPSAN
jgi:hypothetical protein